LNKVNWNTLCSNSFSKCIKRTEMEKYKLTFNKTLDDINNYIYAVPSGVYRILPKGGRGYLEMIEKYKERNQ